MNTRKETILKNFRKNETFLNTTVKNNIEIHRKGTAKLIVTDENGKPIPGALVKFCQKSHEFKFGANLFMLDELETDEKNKQYKEYFKEIFNLATLPFYWSDLEPERGKPRYGKESAKIYRRPAPDLCIEYCRENNIEPKLHCLTYDNFIPTWLLSSSTAEIKKEYTRRFREIAKRYSETIPTMEVTNELLCGSDKPRSDFFFADDNAEWSWRTADKFFPFTKLIINEAVLWELPYPTTNRNAYYMQIEQLLSKNVRIDSVGMQFHSFWPREREKELISTRYNPEFVYSVLNKFAQLGRPLQITEMTIPAFTDTEEDEAIQAELLNYIYTIFFSHPAMEAIIYWNLPDGYAAFAPQGDMKAGENYYRGGLLRFDFTKKPAFHVLDELINKRWHAEGKTGTDDGGNAAFHGFYGKYDVTVVTNGKETKTEIDLRKGSQNSFTLQIGKE